MAQTQYGDIGTRAAAHAAKQMLDHARPVLILEKFGQSRPMPKNSTETVKFRRPVPLPLATTPLVEGVTPTATKMAYDDVPATLKQYGDVVEISDRVHDLAEDPVLKDAAMLCGEQAGATIEDVTWGVLRAGTTVFYANGASRAAVNTKISKDKVRAVVRNLQAQKARRITAVLDGSVHLNTTPIEASYIAVAHTNVENDIRDLPGFVPVAEYGTRKTVCEYELGTVENVRFVLSPDLGEFADAGGLKDGATGAMKSTGGTNADIYPIVFFGKEAFGCVPLRGSRAVTPTVINPSTPSKSDPLGQRGYVGWKTYYTAVRLNETWMARLEVAASEL
ncbi:N4-gp56 family major capsid protein [Eilatimonas milleporae]|uniref:N4-gp56 family major capsid protein n=1 Tax=Eilatimonas milleporae TaxID=911205 RepID=A0A3M0CTZ5_9PROT|nr:N4-gp56 family major capsid protein [Eilatimonas milleporae]RMB11920.1 N4-gp56 family major capsid protein [Eilatimonas milleporae]